MVAVNYTLTVDGQIADKNPEGNPLEFICGAGMLLPKFEGALLGKEPGDKVSFTLEPADGYGEIIAEAIVELPKTIFMIDGKVAEDILFEGKNCWIKFYTFMMKTGIDGTFLTLTKGSHKIY